MTTTIASSVARTVARLGAVEVGARALGRAIAADARATAPVESGRYRDTIRSETRPGPDGTSQIVVVAGDGRDVWYAHIVEFGTAKTPARAVLRRAAERHATVTTRRTT